MNNRRRICKDVVSTTNRGWLYTWLYSQPLFDYNWRTGIVSSRVAMRYDLLIFIARFVICSLFFPFFFFFARKTSSSIVIAQNDKFARTTPFFCLFRPLKAPMFQMGHISEVFYWYHFFVFRLFFIIYYLLYIIYYIFSISFFLPAFMTWCLMWPKCQELAWERVRSVLTEN